VSERQRANVSGGNGTLPAPPAPSPALLEAMARVTPVRLRRPGRAFAFVAAASAAFAGAWLAAFPARPDLPFLPRLWFGALALGWFAAFLGPLAAAMIPRRGAVLPDAPRAGRLAAAAVLVLLFAGFALTPSAPGHTIFFEGARAQVAGVLRCMTFALLIALVPLLFGIVALRRVLLVGSARVTAAVGAAGGALGGLVLHLLCPAGGAVHVGLGHGGGVAVAALLGAGIGALLDRRRA